VSWITARRRHRVAGYAVVPLGLAAVGVMYASLTGPGGQAAASAPPSSQQNIARGKYLFEQSCSSCHGLDAQGTSVGPALIGAGAAAVNFQMSTGRMPAKEPGAEMDRRPVVFSPKDINAIASYVASLGGGPPVPTEAQASPVGANSGLGQQIFNANCAACHNFVGAGGALTDGKYAPALNHVTPVQIYEAMLTGPEAMPAFSDSTITPSEKRDIIAYVTKTAKEPNPGGFSLGRVGPVTEGLVAWGGGIGLLIIVAIWIAARRRDPSDKDA
jgi:ubiquinol-cytochrome c reductase cytochrome c subunit